MTTIAPTADPLPSDVLLADAGLALGEWLGSVLPGIDAALAEVSDSDWAPGTRDLVMRWIGNELVQQFSDGDATRPMQEDRLEAQAAIGLAHFAIARARLLTIRERAARVEARRGTA